MFSVRIVFCILSLAIMVSGSVAEDIVWFPSQIDENCRGGSAKIFDECSDQVILFHSALEEANQSGKTLLVSFGAEWCIWCHVFDAYIDGGRTRFDYVYASLETPDEPYQATLYEKEKSDVTEEAMSLFEFVQSNFVVAHIENYHSPNGYSVLELSNALRSFDGAIPYIFSVDHNGKYVGQFISKGAETRRDFFDWYRGYDRRQLTLELDRLKQLAE